MRGWIMLPTLLLAACATMPREPPPHAEVGIAFDRNQEIASFADGVADPQSGRLVTIDDPVRVAHLEVWPAAAIAIAAGFALRGMAIARGWSLPAYKD